MSTDQNNKETEVCDLNQLASTMTKGIRRWEKVIYPMMVAFIILAAYGFWLIYNVTKDMNAIASNMVVMTKAVVTMTNTLNQNMNQIDHQMGVINIQMDKMNTNMLSVTTMSGNITEMTEAINNMNASVNSMSHSVYAMVYSTSSMSSNLGELNENISVPMNSMNSVIPWSVMPGKNKRNRPPPPVQMPAYNYPVAPYHQPAVQPSSQPNSTAQPETNQQETVQ